LILKNSDFASLSVSFSSSLDPLTNNPISFSFDSSDFAPLPPGSSLFKLAAKEKIRELSYQDPSEEVS